MGVLYAVLYAQSASGSLLFHPFPISLMVFCRIFLICLLDVCGCYGVAMLCLVLNSLR